MTPDPDLSTLFHWVVANAPKEMPATRAKLYRGLGGIIGNEADARKLFTLAQECDALDFHCRQLVLDFGKQTQAGNDSTKR